MYQSIKLAAVALFLQTSLLVATQVAGAELDAPTGEPVLTIRGAVAEKNAGDAVVFDLKMLKAMSAQEFTTSTIWTEGKSTFTGVNLAGLLEFVGASGTTLRATAINDYAVEIPVDSLSEAGPIIAYLVDGEEMSVRDKGPLWVVYPYDQVQDYANEVTYSRSIWQLVEIDVIE